MSYAQAILADSITKYGVRVTTHLVTFPRFILAETNTPRVLARNSASSRAKPTEDLIAQVLSDAYFEPDTINERVKGMGIGVAVEGEREKAGRRAWRQAANDAARAAQVFVDNNLDKSRANRLLEPFLWHTAILTSTEWANFFGLRCPADGPPDPDFPAQIEFQTIACMMRDAMRENEPTLLEEDEWHTPLGNFRDLMEIDFHQYGASDIDVATDRVLRCCARRVARVSYDRHLDTEPYVVSVDKAGELVTSGHFSPTEHICRPLMESDVSWDENRLRIPLSSVPDLYDSDGAWFPAGVDLGDLWCGNLRGWWQYRKNFENEFDITQNGEWPS